MRGMSDRAKHEVFTRALRRAGPGEAVEIPKAILRSLPHSYEKTILGTPSSLAVPDSEQQFRGPYGRHVYERKRSWVVHREAADPRQYPIEHLIVDAPEWGAGLLAASVFGIAAGRSTYDRALQQGTDRETATRNAIIDGVIVGAASGLIAFGALKLAKALFRK